MALVKLELGGVLCAVHEFGSTTVVIVTYDSTDGNMPIHDTQHCFVADGEGEISYDAQLIMIDNVREADGGKVYITGDELLVVRAAQSATTSGGEAAVASQADHPCKTYIPSTGITDHTCITSTHETLPWGSHYRNLVTASGHAWVAFTLPHNPQVQ